MPVAYAPTKSDDAGTSTLTRSPTCSGVDVMPNVNRVVMLPAELYRRTMQYAARHEISWNDAIRLLVEQALGEDGGEDS